MKIFDVHYVHNHEAIGKSCEVRLLSLKDSQFQLDKAIFDELDEKNSGDEVFSREKKELNIEYFSYNYSFMSALSINWPFLAFSGLENTLVIINAFDRKMIHRIEMVHRHDFSIDGFKQTKVEKTFITDTNDLFVLVNCSDHFLLYIIDLDFCNLKENKDRSLGDIYNLGKPILKYHEDQVQGQKV